MERNDRGERLVEFCRRNNLMVTNTWFQQENRRRYTWKQPGDARRYQIDYILVRKRYRNSVKSSWSYPGADADTDHNLVKMKMRVKLKVIKRGKEQQKWNMEKFNPRGTKWGYFGPPEAYICHYSLILCGINMTIHVIEAICM